MALSKASALRHFASVASQHWHGLPTIAVQANHLSTTSHVDAKSTVFEKLGGKAAVKAAVDIFYGK